MVTTGVGDVVAMPEQSRASDGGTMSGTELRNSTFSTYELTSNRATTTESKEFGILPTGFQHMSNLLTIPAN